MKSIRSLLSVLLLAGSLGLIAQTALAAEDVMRPGVLYVARIPGANYCHLMFPHITWMSLFTDKPVLEAPKAGALIDYYGRCDHDPLGPEEVRRQRMDFDNRMNSGN